MFGATRKLDSTPLSRPSVTGSYPGASNPGTSYPGTSGKRRFSSSRALLFAIFLPLTVATASSPAQQAPPTLSGQPDAASTQPDGGYASFAPTPGMNMSPTPTNPLIGSWAGKESFRDGNSSLVVFIDFLPNGTFRTLGIVDIGPRRGVRLQLWGKYVVEQTGDKTFLLTATDRHRAPRQFCTKGGSCQPNEQPVSVKEKYEMLDPDHFRLTLTEGGVESSVEGRRISLPSDFSIALPDTVTLPEYPDPLPPRPSPLPVMEHCDDQQQMRICIVLDGQMYTDSRGCRFCASPEETKPPPK